MARKASLSGFPEWLPQERAVEQHVLDTLRRIFELHGFANIETRAVETVGQLLRKGEIDKEVYGLSRLAAEESAKNDPNALALHFDLTVPFARYVVENAGHLAFPFRRYQMQKVWRGERPQDGRFREFTQADIDVVGDGELPFRYDVELALVIAEALSALPIGDFRLRVNNRKLAEGFYLGLGLTDTAGVLRSIDKLEKIGAEKVAELLKTELGATDEQAAAALSLAQICTQDTSFVEQVRALGVTHPLMEEGLDELRQVIEAAVLRAPGKVVADLSIARGLDYYTGTVYETVLVGHESLGSICSGGRYESLASTGKKNYPGVGLSIGVTRLVSRMLAENTRCCRPLGAKRRACHPGQRRLLERRPGRRRRAALPRHRLRGRGQGREVRQADQVRGQARHPVCLVHRRGRHSRGQGHPHRRPGTGRSVRAGAPRRRTLPTWSAPPCRPLRRHCLPTHRNGCTSAGRA